VPLYSEGDKKRITSLEPTGRKPEDYRSDWRRDYARVIHSAAFRRLQGKTQLFPGHESDFYRNRLTHSLEVAQIAKSIALQINATELAFKEYPIDTDLVEVAALAHDLGHPPFGHNGEEALDERMRNIGGFEGNAQSLRIVARLEKRQTEPFNSEPRPVVGGVDKRVGLNLAYRTMAAILKYDHEIPRERQNRPKSDQDRPIKGYYYTEATLVSKIKENLGTLEDRKLRTIECSIMDVADDIAYSTYDLEDAFKAGFLTPLSMLSASEEILKKVSQTITERLGRYYPELKASQRDFSYQDVSRTLLDLFSHLFDESVAWLKSAKRKSMDPVAVAAGIANAATIASERIATIGYYRTRLTSDLVGKFIQGVQVTTNTDRLVFSTVKLDVEIFKQVEVLKNFAFQALIMSPTLKVTEHRGKDIVTSIFDAINKDEGHMLMPDDFRSLYNELKEPDERKRVICDFIAGMTDRYAIKFYSRMFGTNPESIHSPL